MIIDETALAAYRDVDGLCHLRADMPGPMLYTDYPAFAARTKQQADMPRVVPQSALKPAFTHDHFSQLSDDDAMDVVALVAFTTRIPHLPITRAWVALEHQCSGYLCHQLTLIGTVIEPKPAIKTAFRDIARANFFAFGGYFDGPDSDPETTAQYVKTIQGLGLSCGPEAMNELCESVYPVDATPEALRICFDDVSDLLYLPQDERAKPLILFLSSNSD